MVVRITAPRRASRRRFTATRRSVQILLWTLRSTSVSRTADCIAQRRPAIELPAYGGVISIQSSGLMVSGSANAIVSIDSEENVAF